jgi:hypothetical protein
MRDDHQPGRRLVGTRPTGGYAGRMGLPGGQMPVCCPGQQVGVVRHRQPPVVWERRDRRWMNTGLTQCGNQIGIGLDPAQERRERREFQQAAGPDPAIATHALLIGQPQLGQRMARRPCPDIPAEIPQAPQLLTATDLDELAPHDAGNNHYGVITADVAALPIASARPRPTT